MVLEGTVPPSHICYFQNCFNKDVEIWQASLRGQKPWSDIETCRIRGVQEAFISQLI